MMEIFLWKNQPMHLSVASSLVKKDWKRTRFVGSKDRRKGLNEDCSEAFVPTSEERPQLGPVINVDEYEGFTLQVKKIVMLDYALVW